MITSHTVPVIGQMFHSAGQLRRLISRGRLWLMHPGQIYRTRRLYILYTVPVYEIRLLRPGPESTPR